MQGLPKVHVAYEVLTRTISDQFVRIHFTHFTFAAMSSLRLWLGGFLPILSWSTCLDHSSLSECLAFRSQDRCLWDVASKTCVSGTSCENRSSLRECESELTTGARWDDTQNQCFWDVRFNQCRWSDECFGLDSQPECLQAHCSWRKSCTPQVEGGQNIKRPNFGEKPTPCG